MDYNFNPNEISFSDLPKAVAHLISEVQTLKAMVQTGENCTEDPDNFVEHTALEDWIDNQDVMNILHISPRTLQTLRSNGTLPYSRINGKIYYRRHDIKKILADNYIMYKIRNEYGKSDQ